MSATTLLTGGTIDDDVRAEILTGSDRVALVTKVLRLDGRPLAELYAAVRGGDEAVLELARSATGDEQVTYRDIAVALGVLAAESALGLRPHPVQVTAAVTLIHGCAAELATGEGKTLVGFLAATGFAVTSRVHIATANTYLAERDASTFAPAYELLGLEVRSRTGSPAAEAHRADVLYATLPELGADTLTDRFATSVDEIVVTGDRALIVDEADAVLLDDAVTPMSLTVKGRPSTRALQMAAAVADLTDDDVVVADGVLLGDRGAERIVTKLGATALWENHDLVGHLWSALTARFKLRRDREYLVHDGRIVMLDELSGRAGIGRRSTGGLHEAIEAREQILGTPVSLQTQAITVDSITAPELVAGYQHLAAMSGTLAGEAGEIRRRYGLAVAILATDQPSRRVIDPDVFHLDAEQRREAVAREAIAEAARSCPVLVVAYALPEAERIAAEIERQGATAVLVSARQAGEEAARFAEAGTPGRITVSTAVAGRGVDIVLGGTDPNLRATAVEAGGLVVLAAGRNMSTRHDRQLTGRCARQGDPGRVRFHLAADDELLELPQFARSTMVSALRDGAVDASRFPVVAERIAAAQSTYAETLRLARDTVLETGATLRRQRSAFLRWRTAMLVADLETMVALACQPALQGTMEAARSRAEIVERVVQTVNDGVPDPTTRAKVVAAVRRLTLAFADEYWASHLARMQTAASENGLASLSQLDAKTEYQRLADRLFHGFAAEVSGRLQRALAGVVVQYRDGALEVELP